MKPENKFDKLLGNKNFQKFMVIMRIATFVLIAVLIFIIIKEIEAIKLMAYDPCQICMEKTDAICSCLKDPF